MVDLLELAKEFEAPTLRALEKKLKDIDPDEFGKRFERFQQEIKNQWHQMTEEQKLEIIGNGWMPKSLIEAEAGRFVKSELRETCRKILSKKAKSSNLLLYRNVLHRETLKIELVRIPDTNMVEIADELGNLYGGFLRKTLEEIEARAKTLKGEVDLPAKEIRKVLIEARDYVPRQLAYRLTSLMEELRCEAVDYATMLLTKAGKKKKAMNKLKTLLKARTKGRGDAGDFWQRFGAAIRKVEANPIKSKRKITAACVAEAFDKGKNGKGISERQLSNLCRKFAHDKDGQHFKNAVRLVKEKGEVN